MVNFLERVPIQISKKFPIRNKKARQRTILYRALSCLEREISDRCDTGGLIHARNAEHDVLATFATECHEPYNVAAIDMTIANRNRHVTTMLGDNVIEQRNRAGMQSQRIFNRLCKLDHVPSRGIAHSAGKTQPRGSYCSVRCLSRAPLNTSWSKSGKYEYCHQFSSSKIESKLPTLSDSRVARADVV